MFGKPMVCVLFALATAVPSVGPRSAYELWLAARAAYVFINSTMWTHYALCEADDARAVVLRFISESNSVVIAFSGTDDYDADFDYNYDGSFVYVGDQVYHKGMWTYQDVLADCLDDARQEIRKLENIEVSYTVGHSLGGSAATIYSAVHSNAIYGTHTFGSAKTTVNSTCNVEGVRYHHVDDPVPQGVTAYANFEHDITTAIRIETIVADDDHPDSYSCQEVQCLDISCSDTDPDVPDDCQDIIENIATVHGDYDVFLTACGLS